MDPLCQTTQHNRWQCMWLSKPACTMSQNFKKRKVDWTRPHKSLWRHDPQWPKNLPLGAICWRFYHLPQVLPWKQSLEHIWEAFLQTSHLVPSPLPPMWLTLYIYQTLMMSQGLWGAINFSFFLFLLTDLSSSSVILYSACSDMPLLLHLHWGFYFSCWTFWP